MSTSEIASASLTWPAPVIQRVLEAAPAWPSSTKGATGVILCAGAGQRMAPLTYRVPKPLLPVLNCPLVWWSMVRMRCAVEQVQINTHHLHAAFHPLEAIAREAEIPFSIVQEPRLTGPFGGVLACRGSVDLAQDVLVLAGDGYYEVDFAHLLDIHRAYCAHLTIGISRALDGSRYGVPAVDDEGRVLQMREKPPGVGATNDASCGVYVMSPAVIARFADRAAVLDWIDVVPVLLADGYNVRAARIDTWHDVGAPGDLLALNLAMLTDQMLDSVANRLEGSVAPVWSQGDPNMPADTDFGSNVLLGPGAIVEPGVSVCNAVVGAGARIGRGAEITNAVILPGTNVPPHTLISDSVWS